MKKDGVIKTFFRCIEKHKLRYNECDEDDVLS